MHLNWQIGGMVEVGEGEGDEDVKSLMRGIYRYSKINCSAASVARFHFYVRRIIPFSLRNFIVKIYKRDRDRGRSPFQGFSLFIYCLTNRPIICLSPFLNRLP